MGMSISSPQISQIAFGWEPLDNSDPGVMNTFSGDMEAWSRQAVEGGNMQEHIRVVKYSGIQRAYGSLFT